MSKRGKTALAAVVAAGLVASVTVVAVAQGDSGGAQTAPPTSARNLMFLRARMSFSAPRRSRLSPSEDLRLRLQAPSGVRRDRRYSVA